MNIQDMSTEELARACDEYIRRAMNIACSNEVTSQVTISITATRYTPTSDYDIHHKVSVGDYGNQNSIDGNNIIHAMNKLCVRFDQDRYEKPVTVQPLLTTTNQQDDGIEDAEFTEANSNG